LKIIAIGNCQTDQIGPALNYAYQGMAEVFYCRWGNDLNDSNLDRILGSADLLVTNLSHDRFLKHIDGHKILQLPDLQFGGYHPDQTYVQLKSADNPSDLMFFGASPASAIALWSFKNGLTPIQAQALYSEQFFQELGYFDTFSIALKILAERFKKVDIDFCSVHELLNSQEMLMHGSWHPKLKLTLHMLASALSKIDIKPRYDPRDLSDVLIDNLQAEFAWSCFPPIADYLGVEGSWCIRHKNTLFPSVEIYLNNFYIFLQQHNPDDLVIPKRDAGMFDLDWYDRVLKNKI
jgi:hypothetical protein